MIQELIFKLLYSWVIVQNKLKELGFVLMYQEPLMVVLVTLIGKLM